MDLLPASELCLAGRHNLSNALAALALGTCAGLPMQHMLRTLRSFSGLPHRMQWVAEQDGICWYNDSKATNIGATVAAITGMDRPVVLIAGGDAKGADFESLRQARKRPPYFGEAVPREPILPEVERVRRSRPLAQQAGASGGAKAGTAFVFYAPDYLRCADVYYSHYVTEVSSGALAPCHHYVQAGAAAPRCGGPPRAHPSGLALCPMGTGRTHLATAEVVGGDFVTLDACGRRHLPGPSGTGL